MTRWGRTGAALAALVVAMLFVTGSAAASNDPACDIEARTLAEQPVWVDAGAPMILCGTDEPYKAHYNFNGGNFITVGPQIDRVQYRHALAHELGHAWASNNGINLRRYARLRGVTLAVAVEDHAEVFAYAIGWYTPPPVPRSPYGFVDAGPPSDRLLARLRDRGLLPG